MNEAARLRECEAQILRLAKGVETIRDRTDTAIRALQQNTLMLASSLEALQLAVQRLTLLSDPAPEAEADTPCH